MHIIAKFVNLYNSQCHNNEDIDVKIDTQKEDDNIISTYQIYIYFPSSTIFELNDLCQIRVCYSHRMTDMKFQIDAIKEKFVISYGFLGANTHLEVKNTTLFVSQACKVETIYVDYDDDNEGIRKRKKPNK